MENGFVTCVSTIWVWGRFLCVLPSTSYPNNIWETLHKKKLTLAPPATRRISSWRAGGEVDGDTHTEPASLKRLDLYR